MQLAQWRTRKNLTIPRAAEFLDLEYETYRLYERGARLPGPRTAELIRKRTKGAVTPNDLHETRLAGIAQETEAEIAALGRRQRAARAIA